MHGGAGALVDIVERQEIVPDQPPNVRRDHDREGQRHHVGTGRAPGAPRQRIEQEEQAERSSEREGRVFRPEGAGEKHARQRPVQKPSTHQRAVEEQAGEGPERQLHLVVRELHDREIVEVDAFECEHCDERLNLAGDLARQPPDAIETQHRRQRSEQIDGVDAAGQPVEQIGDPPRQRRMLPIAELPFLAQSKVLGEIELQVGADEDRQHRPHQKVQSEHHSQDPAGPAPRMVDQRRKAYATGGLRDCAVHAWLLH